MIFQHWEMLKLFIKFQNIRKVKKLQKIEKIPNDIIDFLSLSPKSILEIFDLLLFEKNFTSNNGKKYRKN